MFPMSLIAVSSALAYQVNAPTDFLFNVAAAQTNHQSVRSEKISLTPEVPYEVSQIGDEHNRVLRLRVDQGPFTLAYQAEINLTPELDNPPAIEEARYAELPSEVLPYLNPSRYCESDRLVRFAQQEFGNLDPGFSRVTAVCNWIHQFLDYVAGTTDARTSACDVLVQRTGVCRDYAHLAIGLCRALCIPARYVSGYAVGLEPPDFHGFFEAYLGNHWYLFDATQMAPTNGLVRIGTGRDAADASFAIIIGAAVFQHMKVTAQELTDDIPDQPSENEPAVSTD
jgi:transglutaminase-like putative cysteine protease